MDPSASSIKSRLCVRVSVAGRLGVWVDTGRLLAYAWWAEIDRDEMQMGLVREREGTPLLPRFNTRVDLEANPTYIRCP